ncbi:MAG: site-2 protease family protein [Ignavibacteriales bacterium]|nr:site-2 protease family protein [Ignavibacteriales bacterium]
MEYLPILPILFFSIVIHEMSHGWMALKLGDPTARDLGRLTLNPIPHIDPIGSILVPALSLMTAGTVFIAWAKPVPVNPANFRNFRRDDILVSAVGPLSNLVVALGCAAGYVFLEHMFGPAEMLSEGLGSEAVVFLMTMCSLGITLNIFLAVFNLIPVPPLDGSHVLASLLPPEIGERYRRIGFFGIFAIILLMRVPWFQGLILGIVGALEMPYALLIDLLI